MHKAPFVFPIIGGRKVEHLQANSEALSISLSPEQVKFIDDVLPFDVGFPAKLIARLFHRSYVQSLWKIALTNWIDTGAVRDVSMVAHCVRTL